MFEVILAPEAQRFYSQADPPLARKLARCFAQLERDPRRHNNIKRLAGEFAGRLRYRIGDWRVIYRIDEKGRQVNVLVVAHRSEVYE
jgi:mRNA interferase RelE/StbE